MDKNMTITQGHHVTLQIEKMIEEKFEMQATIHVEPLE